MIENNIFKYVTVSVFLVFHKIKAQKASNLTQKVLFLILLSATWVKVPMTDNQTDGANLSPFLAHALESDYWPPQKQALEKWSASVQLQIPQVEWRDQ